MLRSLVLCLSLLCLAQSARTATGVIPKAGHPRVTTGAVASVADTLAPRRAYLTRKEVRELRRLERVERNLDRYASRHDGLLPPLRETAGNLDVISFAAALGGLALYAAAFVFNPLIFVSVALFPTALVCGIIARRRIKYGAIGRRRLAVTGAIIGAMFTVALLAGAVAAIVFALA